MESPFDKFGRLRTDLDTVDISSLTPELAATWRELVDAITAGEAAEERYRTAEKNCHAAVKALQDVQSKMPRLTHHDLWKAEVKHIPMPRPSPELEAALGAAHEALDNAQLELRNASVALQPARMRTARANSAWNRAAPTISAEENAARFRAAELQTRMDRAAGRVAPPRPMPHGPSVIDAMAAATKGGSHRAGGGFAWKRGFIDKSLAPGRAMSLAQSQTALNQLARAEAAAALSKK